MESLLAQMNIILYAIFYSISLYNRLFFFESNEYTSAFALFATIRPLSSLPTHSHKITYVPAWSRSYSILQFPFLPHLLLSELSDVYTTGLLLFCKQHKPSMFCHISASLPLLACILHGDKDRRFPLPGSLYNQSPLASLSWHFFPRKA